MARSGWLAASAIMLTAGASAPAVGEEATALRFEVGVAAGLLPAPEDGRLLVVIGRRAAPSPARRSARRGPASRRCSGRTRRGWRRGPSASWMGRPTACRSRAWPTCRRGITSSRPSSTARETSAADDAPGNLVGAPRRVHLDPAAGGVISLELDRALPPEELPPERELLRFVKLPSPLLSAFHERPISLRAGIILPRDFGLEPDREYPLRVHVGGFGERYTEARAMMAPGSPFRKAWLADDAPRMILLHLDGAGPLGDPYQVDSANHGPYGEALMKELIPHVERQFRGIGRGSARVLDGGSTGGWVSLALQVFYPDDFAGAWGFCPDPVDFRSFERVDLYKDANAYVDANGDERPAAREVDGRTKFTMRHECQMENVLGRAGSYTLSGGQWGSWVATFGARGPDGLPVPPWDAKTGRIDSKAVEYWKRYDLRMILEENWQALGPKLRGKLHIAVGEADDYFLNDAVHRLDAFLARADPPAEASIRYGEGKGHCWDGLTDRELMDEMATVLGR